MFRTATLSYILPTHRLTVYIMGVALGYVLHRVPESFRFSKVRHPDASKYIRVSLSSRKLFSL